MEIVLLDPPKLIPFDKSIEVVNAPLSSSLFSGYISSLLKKEGFKVKIIWANKENLSLKDTLLQIKKEKPLLLGVNLSYQWKKTKEVLEMLEEVKFSFSPHINLYGYFPTFAYEELLLNNIFIDTITLGEAEYTFLELARLILDNRAFSEIQNIEGLSYIKCNKVVKNKPRKLILDLDSLPFPERDNLNTLPVYILGSRGCYNQCSFCYLNPFYGRKIWRGRSVENIILEIKELLNKGVSYFYFADANFFGKELRDKKIRGERLSSLLKELNKEIRFGLECRADDVEKETFKKLKEAGLREVFLGVENASWSTLKRFKKNIEIRKNIEAIKTIQDLDIHLFLGFIMFDPETTFKDLEENFSFLKERNLLKTPTITAQLLSQREFIFSGMPDYKKYLKEGRLNLSNNFGYEASYEFAHPQIDHIYKVMRGLNQKIQSSLRGKDLKPNLSSLEKERFRNLNSYLISTFQKALSFFKEEKNLSGEIGEYFLEKTIIEIPI